MPETAVLFHWLNVLANTFGEKGITLYIVGGFLRDLLMGIRSPDLDITGPAGTLQAVQEFAQTHGLPSHYVAHYGLLRVVCAGYRLDFTEFQKELTDNLAGRDFSINAMALSIADYLSDNQNAIIDPYQGKHDLQKKILRALPNSLKHDPVRILRGARLAHRYLLEPTADTAVQALMFAPELNHMPAERVAAEVLAALSGSAHGYLKVLTQLGADIQIFGRSLHGRPELTVSRLESLLQPGFFPGYIEDALQKRLLQRVTIPHRRIEVMRLGAILLNLYGQIPSLGGRPVPLLIAKKERMALQAMSVALSWLQLSQLKTDAEKICDYFRLFGAVSVEGILLYCAAAGPQSTKSALTYLEAFANKDRLVSPPVYLSRRAITAEAGRRGLPAGEFSNVIAVLHRASALCKINSTGEAKAYLSGYLNGNCSIQCRKNANQEGMGNSKSNM